MSPLGDDVLVVERLAFLSTIEQLTDEEFERGTTLCAGWAPRDVLAHLIATNDLLSYLRHGMRITAANAVAVERGRKLTRAELTTGGRSWAKRPTVAHRLSARAFLGDVSMHHQDVLRGLGRRRELPVHIAAAIFREGIVLSTATSRNLLSHRVEPTPPGGHAIGRGRLVRGSTEALGLWLGGRKGLDAELQFSPGLADAAPDPPRAGSIRR